MWITARPLLMKEGLNLSPALQQLAVCHHPPNSCRGLWRMRLVVQAMGVGDERTQITWLHKCHCLWNKFFKKENLHFH